MNLGFIGLGIMGAPMAGPLRAAGHTLFVSTRRKVPAALLDAPVSGGEVGAKAATLTIMVGGSETTFARLLPLLQLKGKNITHVGANGPAFSRP